MSDKIILQNEGSLVSNNYPFFEKHKDEKQRAQNNMSIETAGASRRHNLISSNMTIAVGSRLRGHKCEIYAGGMRVRLADRHSSYPDIVAVKDEPKFDENEPDLLLNPTLVVEIFTPATLCHDKTEKLDQYLAMDSVRDLLLIKEDGMRVEHYSKQAANQWIYRIYNRREDTVPLESINCRASIAEIYAQVKFD